MKPPTTSRAGRLLGAAPGGRAGGGVQEADGATGAPFNAIPQHTDYPWMPQSGLEIVGEPGLLEIKTRAPTAGPVGEDKARQVRSRASTRWRDGRDWVDLAVLIGGQQFLVTRVHRDDELIATLIDIERRFWEEHVVPRIPPEPDGHDVDMRVLASLYPESDPDSIVALPNDAEHLIRQYEDAKAAEAQWAEVRQQPKRGSRPCSATQRSGCAVTGVSYGRLCVSFGLTQRG